MNWEIIRIKSLQNIFIENYKKLKYYKQGKIVIFFSGFLFLVLVFILFDLLFPIKINIHFSSVVTDADNSVLHAYLSNDDKWRMYISTDEITPELKKAILFKEDKYFYFHPGINPFSVSRALYNNIIAGKRTSGASTVTMQVARLLKPKKRTYLNKIVEMFRALQLEWHFSKKEILQMYLNIVPYGGNIEGVKAASLIYYNKMPDHLSIGEIATLSIIPNRPNSLRPGENNEKLKRERNKWLNRYKNAALFVDKDINDAIEEPLTAFRYQIPGYAPQFCYRMVQSSNNPPVIHTTLKLETQLKVESLLKEHINRWYFRNVKNAAAMVIDNKTGNVIAYVGSADYTNTEDGGQVDGVRAIRSPGSTLKPLIYGLAFDKGIITPKTVISDVPVYYTGYEPENYDGKFHGLVDVEYALSNSLNIPAVKILYDLTTETLVNALIKAGFRQIKKDRDNLGLSLALGGCGVTLEELTHLFYIFSNQGELKRLNYLKNNEKEIKTKKRLIENAGENKSYRIISTEASFLVTDILTKVTRPDLPAEWRNSAKLPKVAWKTGTSYGRRDAWSIGYNKNFTVGVWVGNFSGEGVPELSGAEAASPLLFNIFNIIDYSSETNWYEIPEDIDSRVVCSASGQVPSEFCNDLAVDYYIPGVSSVKPCLHLKEVNISPDSSVSYCMTCRPELGYIKTLYPNYASEIIAYYEEYHINYKKIPTHNPACERVFAGSAPIIVSPLNHAEYFIDETDSMQIALSCNCANDVEKVFWYINRQYYRSCLPTEKIFFNPAEGRIEISCSDDKGRNSDIVINVKKIGF